MPATATPGVETGGYLVHVAGTVLGIWAVLAVSAAAFTAVKLAGGAYLLVLAVRAWRSRDTRTLAELARPGANRVRVRTAYLRALAVLTLRTSRTAG